MRSSRLSKPSSPGPTPLQKLLLVGFGLAALAATLALVETALRVADVGSPNLYEDPFVGFAEGRDLFVRAQDGPDAPEVWRTSPEKLAFFDHQEFSAPKSADTYRVFALGGSTTAGRPYDSQVAFPAWLERYLAAAAPDRRFEVVNAGGISYASYRMVVLMRELVRYQPDLFVVYTGHNEFLEERTYSDIIHESPRLRKLRLRLNGLRSYTLARQAVRSMRASKSEPPSTLDADVTTRLETWRGLDLYQRDEELRLSIVAHFEYNLRQIAAIARGAGVPLIFVKPISNLKDFSPFKSEHGSSVTADDRPRIDEFLRKARAASDAGDWDTSEALCEQATRLGGDYALSRYEWGRALFALGRFEDAERALIAAKDLDVAPLRALEEQVEIVANVARDEGLRILDLPTVVGKNSLTRYGHAIPGSEVLLDHVHPTTEIHSLIAEGLLEFLVADGTIAPAPSWTPEAQRRIYDRIMSGLDERYYAQRDLNLAKVLGWSGKLEEAEPPLRRAAEVLTDNPEVFLNLGIVLQRTGRFEEAEEVLETAVSADPDSPAAWFNLGVARSRGSRSGKAIEAFRAALRLQKDYPEASFNLGRLELGQGRFENAIQHLEQALRSRPEAAEIHRSLATAYRELGRTEEAGRSLARALELAPDDPAAWVERGVSLALAGNLEEAAGALSNALKRDPANAEAHFNLGLVHRRRDNVEGASNSYLAAITADPNHVGAHVNLGVLLASRGQLEGALPLLLRAVALAPDYADAHFNLGVCYDGLGDRRSALESIRRSLAIDPQNARYQQALGMLTAAQNR